MPPMECPTSWSPHHINTVLCMYALMCKPFLAENGTCIIVLFCGGNMWVVARGLCTLVGSGDAFFIRSSFCGYCWGRNV